MWNFRLERYLKKGLSRFKGRPVKHRRFIESKMGVAGFFNLIKEDNVSYVALRWFDSLPILLPGEDVDILVADEDVDKMCKLLRHKGKEKDVPCDIYSVSGLPGTNHHQGSYYPPDKARQMLDNAIFLNDLIRVPSVDDHFLSLGYHAIYHKGYLSGIPSAMKERNGKVRIPEDHDYAGCLKRLQAETSFADMGVQIRLEDLDDLYAGLGWRPDVATLKRLSKKNQWIGDHFFV